MDQLTITEVLGAVLQPSLQLQEPTLLDLNQFIHHQRETLATIGNDNVCPCRNILLQSLCVSLEMRFTQHGNQLIDINEAIKYLEMRLTSSQRTPVMNHACLDDLARSLAMRFEYGRDPHDLDRSIEYYRKSCGLLDPEDEDYPLSLSNLARSLRLRCEYGYSESQSTDDLKEAITCCSRALEICPPHHESRGSILVDLASALELRFELDGQFQDLQDAIMRRCEAAHSKQTSGQMHTLNNFTLLLLPRDEARGQLDHLNEAIALYRQILKTSSRENDIILFNRLGTALHDLYLHTGISCNLDESLEFHCRALDALPAEHESYSGYLYNLAVTLTDHGKCHGQTADMKHIVQILRQALSLCPPQQTRRRSEILFNLAGALMDCYELRLGGVDNLKEAISCSRDALQLYQPGLEPEAWFRTLNLLALALGSLFKANSWTEPEKLTEAMTLFSRALALCPTSHFQRPFLLNNLAVVTSAMAVHQGRAPLMEQAVYIFGEALSLCSKSHPLFPTISDNHLKACRKTSRGLGLLDGFEEACGLLEFTYGKPQSSQSIDLDPTSRFGTAVSWATYAQTRQHGTTIPAYSQGLISLEQALMLIPTVELQRDFFMRHPRAGTLALDAAAYALNEGNVESAIVLLEQGRALVWSRLRGYRTPLEKIRRFDSSLAEQFEALSKQLEELAIASSEDVRNRTESPPVLDIAEKWVQQRTLSRQWDQTLAKIRLDVPGFENFLRPAPYPALVPVADEGPVILINLSEYRSDAIFLLNPGSWVMPLEDGLPSKIRDLFSEFSIAQQCAEDEFSRRMRLVLRELWELVVEPVVEMLSELNIPEGSRIWWCPTSTLCALPLHAAGPYISGSKNFSDLYVSSYTPSLQALLKARENVSMDHDEFRILAVGLPETLPMVNKEISIIRKLGSFVDTLVSKRATCVSVITQLPRYDWIHFACHGRVDTVQPFLSSFQLYRSERLTLHDIMQTEFPNAKFAFLSACHSAAGDYSGTPDEVLHLAAAMQFCGFRSVVGTLWEMRDVDGPSLTEKFYRRMLRLQADGEESRVELRRTDFKQSARALHEALQEMSQQRSLEEKRKRAIDRLDISEESDSDDWEDEPASAIEQGMRVDPWVTFVHVGA